MASPDIYLPLQFNQLVDLLKALPKKQKQQIIELLEEDELATIPEWQKTEVHKRIEKYNENPELLVDEEQAMKIINGF